VHRDFKQFMGMTDTGSVWVPATIQDPGPDDKIATADDGQLLNVFRQLNPGNAFLYYTNPAGAYRRYDGLQFIATLRHATNLAAEASYTWSRNRGTVGNQDNVNAGQNDLGELPSPNGPGVFTNPNALINADGRAPYDLSEFKAIATYRLPRAGGLRFGGVLRHETGVRWGRVINYFPGTLSATDFVTVRAEPRGARSLPSVTNLDLRVGKDFSISGRKNLEVFADLFNVTNQGVPLFVFGAGGPSFGQVLNRSDPRNGRVAARFTF